jgi:hypothetical protein
LREKASPEHHGILVALADRLEQCRWAEIEEIPSAVDLWARHPVTGVRVLFEAKTISFGNDAHQVRDAVVQLHEYRFQHSDAADLLCLVTNNIVNDRRVRFAEHMGIAVIRIAGGSIEPCGALAQHIVGDILG